MRWILLALVALILSAVAQRYSRLVAALIIVVAIVIGIFAWYQQQSLETSRQRIPVTQIELLDFKLAGDSGNSRELTGRLRNNSARHTVKEITLQVIMQDCLNGRCSIVDQATARFGKAIRPGKVRAIRRRITFTALPEPQGEYRPRFQVITVKGG
jgi:hypothetical protein